VPGWRMAPTRAPTPADAPKNSLVAVGAGKVVLGKPWDFPSFGWDNECVRSAAGTAAATAVCVVVV
jgi:hypothetical protein